MAITNAVSKLEYPVLSKYWVYKYLTNLCVHTPQSASESDSESLSRSLYLWERLDLFVVRVHTSMNRGIALSLSLLLLLLHLLLRLYHLLLPVHFRLYLPCTWLI